MPLFLATDAVRQAARQIWHGKANRLSRDDPLQWEILNQVEVASWKSSTEQRAVELTHDRPAVETSICPSARESGLYPDRPSAGQVIRQR